jgi:hypothetical protein
VIQKHPWLLKAGRKILSLFSAKEVRTPLSFFHRLITAIVTLATLGVFLIQPTERLALLIGAGVLILVMAMIVAVIAWARPQNLVLRESGYRRLPANTAFSATPPSTTRTGPLNESPRTHL